MVSSELIGISILAVVAVVIVVIYVCKCYSDYVLSHHKENIRPIDLDDEQDLALISVDCIDPIPNDPYCEDVEIDKKDHNDIEMVSLSIEQFIRKESYRKSIKVNKPRVKKFGRYSKTSSSSGIEEHAGNTDSHGISNNDVEFDGRSHQPIASVGTFGVRQHQPSRAIDAPVIVHHPHGLNYQQPISPPSYDHIYASIDKSKPNPVPASQDAPTYFRPVKSSVSANFSNHSSLTTQEDQIQPGKKEPEIEPPSSVRSSSPSFKGGQDQEEKANMEVSRSPYIPRKPVLESGENIPQNEQQMTEENLFFIPEEVFSPKSTKKSRRTSERTIKTLDGLEVNDKPKASKKSKSRSNGKSDSTGTPKGHKRRKKSIPDLDIAKATKVSDIAPMSPKSSENVTFSGLRSPPIPPKPQFNPLLSPTVQTKSNMHVRTSQL